MEPSNNSDLPNELHSLRQQHEQLQRAYAALEAGQLQLRQMMDTAPGVVYQYELHPDGRGRFVYLSRGMQQLSGFPIEYFLEDATRSWQIIHPDDAAALQETFRIAVSAHQPWVHEFRICSADGGVKWVRGNSIPQPKRPDGSSIWNGLYIDITDRKHAEQLSQIRDRLEAENQYLQEEVWEAHAFGAIIGRSPALTQVLRQIELVAPTDATVLIQGESGTGKELIAHAIHRRSGRNDRALIRVNCAAIPRELYESEFFGHIKGSFTGALKDRMGRLAAADGGTLFLDEVGEIPLELQSKLLRVIQEKQYERVGEERTRRTDVRFIAATNRNLRQEVAEGRFREDLYYRLNVVPIFVPPLRERREDISLLAAHLLEQATRQFKRPPLRLSEADLTRLASYHWPGNVRELQHVIERSVILSRPGHLHLVLPDDASEIESEHTQRAAEPKPAEGRVLTDGEVRRFERQNMAAALDQTRWKIYGPGGAAEALGVKPQTLISRMRKLGITKPTQS